MVVAEALIETLKPIQNQITLHLNDKSYLASTLIEGAQKASSIATDTWKLVRKRIGISAL